MLIFVESSLFSRLVYDYLSEDEFTELQNELLDDPDAGLVIPKSGGMRKLRWAAKGKGKRGGVRIIYYWQKADDEIWLLTIYAKNEEENIPTRILQKILEEFD
jgi:mRNA-degrading endonuclease RelE of RelBE toxin-antitoxin system